MLEFSQERSLAEEAKNLAKKDRFIKRLNFAKKLDFKALRQRALML